MTLGVAVGVLVLVGVAVPVGVADGVGVNVAVGEAVRVAVTLGVMDGVNVAGGGPMRTIRGATQMASSSRGDPLADTVKMNFPVSPASALRSRSTV